MMPRSEEVEMSNEQVISLLDKMDVEEQTLRPLWDQFTVARRQARVVLNRYVLCIRVLPGLEERQASLERDILALDGELVKRKDEVRDEVSRYRESLEGELASLERQVAETRERVVGVQGALREAETNRQRRMEELRDEVQVLEGRRDLANQSLAEARKVLGAV